MCHVSRHARALPGLTDKRGEISNREEHIAIAVAVAVVATDNTAMKRLVVQHQRSACFVCEPQTQSLT